VVVVGGAVVVDVVGRAAVAGEVVGGDFGNVVDVGVVVDVDADGSAAATVAETAGSRVPAAAEVAGLP
jgi:hypothetical protein